MNITINKVKIVTMIPEESVNKLRDLIWQTGAGTIGNYEMCSVSTKVEGTFKANNLANPYIGIKNKLEKVPEIKLELICPINKVKEVLNVIHENHPYETPGIEIVPLIDENFFN